MTGFNPRGPQQQASVGSPLSAMHAQGGAQDRRELSVLTSWLGGSVVKKSPADEETRVPSLGQEEPLEKETATHSSIPAWEITQTEEAGGLQSTGLQKSWT